MDAFTCPGFLSALKTQMVARLAGEPDLAKVEVALVAPPPDETPEGDFLYLVTGKIVDDSRLAGATRTRPRDELLKIPGCVQAYATARAGGDDAFQPAFERANQVLSELAFELRDNAPTVGRQTRSAIIGEVRWTPMPHDKGGWAVRGDYVLTYSTRVS